MIQHLAVSRLGIFHGFINNSLRSNRILRSARDTVPNVKRELKIKFEMEKKIFEADSRRVRYFAEHCESCLSMHG